MPADPRLSRRTALAVGALGVLTASGCAQRTETGPRVAPDPDGPLVDEAVARITATAALAGAVPTLVSTHAAHLAALDAEPPTSAVTPMAELRRSERELRSYLVEAAMRAESGPLARLFASMSAALAQQLVVLPEDAA